MTRYALYVFDYGAPTGFRLAVMHPERVSAIISQNGNAYREGLSDAWKPYQAYWSHPSDETRNACRAALTPEATRSQYLTGSDPARVSPDGYNLDIAYLGRPGQDEIQLDLIYDYRTNVESYPQWQAYFRERRAPRRSAAISRIARSNFSMPAISPWKRMRGNRCAHSRVHVGTRMMATAKRVRPCGS